MFAIVYITAKDVDEAKKIGNTLVKEKLVGCVNIIPKIESIYWWEGEIEKDVEAVVIAKTLVSKIQDVINKTKEIHSYENPCILAIPIITLTEEYAKWLKESLK